MKLPKVPKIKLPKPVHIKPPKPVRLVKPKLPAHMKGTHTNHPAGKQQLPPGALPPAPNGIPAPNTTWDAYISPNAPPAAADQTGIQVHLEAEFEMATQHSHLDPTFRWTHRAYVQDTEDIRDTWPSAPTNKVYIPNKNGTPYLVVFVEVINRNTPQQYKRVFLQRQTPTWPTDNV